MSAGRERAVTEAFVSMANTLVEGLDMVDLLGELTTTCARLLDIASAGLLLADARGTLHVLAASSERTRNLELFQLQREQGPCLDCFRSGTPVSVADLVQEAARWPQFVPAAAAVGFASVHALPMRLRDNVLGVLGLFGTATGALDDDDLSLAQALAHVATVTLTTNQATTDQALLNQQLQTALASRVLIEQAKGVLAERGNLDMDQAFAVLRRYARDHNRRLSEVARDVVTRELAAARLLAHAAHTGAARPPSSSR